MMKKRQASSVEPSAGPPAASPARWAARTCGSPEIGRKFVNAPSASSPARPSIFSRSAASTIGTGVRHRPLEPQAAVALLRGDAEHRPQPLHRLAHLRRAGRVNSRPLKRSTITFEEAPSPSTNRPPLAS